jgi:hypothetical protein
VPHLDKQNPSLPQIYILCNLIITKKNYNDISTLAKYFHHQIWKGCQIFHSTNLASSHNSNKKLEVEPESCNSRLLAMRAPQNAQKGPLGLIPKIEKRNIGTECAVLGFDGLCWKFFNVWVGVLGFQGNKKRSHHVSWRNDGAKRVLAGTVLTPNARAYMPLSKAYIRSPFASCARCKIRGEQRKGELQRCETAELKRFDKQCFFFRPNFDLKNMISTYTKDFPWTKLAQIRQISKKKGFQIARFLS